MTLLRALLFSLSLVPALAVAQGTVSGAVTYLERIALPPDAKVLVEVIGSDGTLLAEARIPTQGAQVPLPFALSVPDDVPATLRAGIIADNSLRWLGDPVPLADDLGPIRVSPYQPAAFTTAWRCGDLQVQTGFADTRLVLDTGTARVLLDPVPAASGAKYVAINDPETLFWSRGDSAMMLLDGVEFPQCRISLPAVQPHYKARGNEPFWAVRLTNGDLQLSRMGMDDLTLPVTQTTLTQSGDILVIAEDPARALRAVLERENTICRDTMTGMPYPETVTLAMGDNVLTGCGGTPDSLLTGRAWQVMQIAGEAVIADSPATLDFSTDGRVTGSSGCNRFFASYALTAESLEIGQAGATMMACAGPVMAQESRFFAALVQVSGFDLDVTGGLILLGPDGPLLRAMAGRTP